MDSDAIISEIDRKIKTALKYCDIDYLIFIKRFDEVSDSLKFFARDNDLSVKIFDIGTDEGISMMDECGILDVDVPCVYSIKEESIVYYGCPDYVEELR